jgi:hypothetical protein
MDVVCGPDDVREEKLKKVEALYVKYKRFDSIMNEIVTEMNFAMYECPVCLDEFSMAELYTSNCVDAHRCCFECASGHIEIALAESKVFSTSTVHFVHHSNV